MTADSDWRLISQAPTPWPRGRVLARINGHWLWFQAPTTKKILRTPVQERSLQGTVTHITAGRSP